MNFFDTKEGYSFMRRFLSMQEKQTESLNHISELLTKGKFVDGKKTTFKELEPGDYYRLPGHNQVVRYLELEQHDIDCYAVNIDTGILSWLGEKNQDWYTEEEIIRVKKIETIFKE